MPYVQRLARFSSVSRLSMRMMVFAVLPSIVLGCATATRGASCAMLQPCVFDQNIAVIGSGSAANTLLKTARIGSRRFEDYFGVAAAPIAIVPGGVISNELEAQLTAAGFAESLPWISPADQRKLQEQAVRDQVLAQTGDLPKAQQDAIVLQALSKLGGASESADVAMSTKEQGALTHELGHIWFMSAFEPQSASSVDAGHGYGGWAPDWLDETAAILMENDALRASRRDAFARIATDDLYPIDEFLTMNHPALASAKALAATFGDEASSQKRAIVLSGEQAQAFLENSKSGDPGVFYTQAQGFIDYVVARTRDERIFSEVAAHLARGKNFANWMSGRPDMPQTPAALAADWGLWLANR